MPNSGVLVRALLAYTRFALVAWFATWALAVATFSLGGHVGAWHAVLGFACGFLALGDPRRHRWITVFVAIATALFVLFAIIMAVAVPDVSWDANMYHFPAIFALSDGWNPLWDRASELPGRDTSPGFEVSIRCFPKATWIFSAAMHQLVGNVDAGKLLAWLVLFAPVGPALYFLRFRMHWGMGTACLGAVIVAANPVALCQISTGYIDGIVGSLSSMFLITALLATGNSRTWAPMAAMLAALLIGSKFTGVVFVGVVSTVILFAALIRRRRFLRFATWACLGSVLGVALSFDSYGLNTLDYGNPLYPAWRPDAPGRSPIDSEASAEFLAHSRLERLVRSVGAPQMSPFEMRATDPTPRVPFTDLHWTYQYDSRVSGFGPVFWEALLLALLAAFFIRRIEVVIAVAAVLASALATDAVWWARLTPQVWLLPILLVAGAQNRAGITLRWLAIVILVANATIVGVKGLRVPAKTSQWWFGIVVADPSAPLPEGYLTADALRRCMARRLDETRKSNHLDRNAPAHPTDPDQMFDWPSRIRLGLGLGPAR